MAAAVGLAPQMGDHMGMQRGYTYPNGISIMEDSEDGDHDDEYTEHVSMEEDMERYYQHHHYQQQMHPEQLQYHHYQPGDDENELEEDEVYSDESSDESILPDENIDFSLIYALHTFLATVEGQASVVKGDSLLLLDDANSYWWLVRVLKTEDVGYIPAENVETPYERLARLNKHRNVDIAAPTKEEAALGETPRENKLKSFIGWKSRDRNQDDAVEEREGRRVVFAPPTYVDHPGDIWSDDEDEDDIDEDELDHHHDDDDHSFEDEGHPEIQGYDIEPDDGVEWAQDAVEAVRSGLTPTAPESSSTDHSMAVESRETAIVTPDNAPMADIIVAVDKDQKGIVGAATIAGAGIATTGTGVEAVVAAHPPPNRSPSPATPSGALARTNPTPPPHRAVVMSPETDTSPEAYLRDVTTPLPTTSSVETPGSSDFNTPSPTPAQRQAPTPSPKSVHRVLGTARAPAATESPRGAPAVNTAVTPQSPITASIATSPGRPTGAASTQPRRLPIWNADAFNISRLASIVRARADEDRRTRRQPKAQDTDAVQQTYYGEKLALDALQPDIRSGYVHLQAKMDSFDREIDNLLGALAAAH